MKKRICALAILLALSVSFLSYDSLNALADGPYRMVLRYYDGIQITYEIKYPKGDIRGVWEGPEDVPIGGVGVPGTGDFVIDDFISGQVYCVDPFTPFHGRVSSVGGRTDWTNTTTDTVSGYVEAAPWTVSGNMRLYGDAVYWLAANGYRGSFKHMSGYDPDYSEATDDDTESKDSVIRLNAMFPQLGGNIDREIALMATKVAIWKAIAGDSVVVKKTTLDGRVTAGGVSKRQIFDDLVNALVSAARNPALRPAGSIDMDNLTALNLEITTVPPTDYDDPSGDEYSYFGPLVAKAELKNPAEAKNMEQAVIYLTASGIDTGGVKFVKKDGGDYVPFVEGKVPGTANLNGAKATRNSVPVDNEWTSEEFYLAIPKSRTPAQGDGILVQAMAKVPQVKVEEGTPVVYTFAYGDVHNWNAIQAFIGVAPLSGVAALYAQASWSTGGTTLGDLFISKQVKNAIPSAVDDFVFAVYYSDDEDGDLSLDKAKRLNLTDHPVFGAYSVDTANNTFTLRRGATAYIHGLPMVVGGGSVGYAYHYWVEEVSLPPRYDKPEFSVDMGRASEGYTVDGNTAGPFQINITYYDVTAQGLMTITNTVTDRRVNTDEDEGEK